MIICFYFFKNHLQHLPDFLDILFISTTALVNGPVVAPWWSWDLNPTLAANIFITELPLLPYIHKTQTFLRGLLLDLLDFPVN